MYVYIYMYILRENMRFNRWVSHRWSISIKENEPLDFRITHVTIFVFRLHSIHHHSTNSKKHHKIKRSVAQSQKQSMKNYRWRFMAWGFPSHPQFYQGSTGYAMFLMTRLYPNATGRHLDRGPTAPLKSYQHLPQMSSHVNIPAPYARAYGMAMFMKFNIFVILSQTSHVLMVHATSCNPVVLGTSALW